MITFKEYLQEALFFEELQKSLGLGFYKNPSRAEMGKIAGWARAIGTATGNLYVTDKVNMSSLHADIEDAIWKFDRKAENNWETTIIELQRIGKENFFALGEQLTGESADPGSFTKSMLKKIKKVNRQLSFTTNNIIQYDVPSAYSGWSGGELQDMKDDMGLVK